MIPGKFVNRSISIGYSGISIYGDAEISEAQVGYSRRSNGSSLVGNNIGDWHESWLVIGCDQGCGDPIFIDTNTNELPVYTAMHGQGQWEPKLISRSYDLFIQILDKLEKIAIGREYPEALKLKPMTQPEYDEFVKFSSQGAGEGNALFWELLVSDEEVGIGPNQQA